MTGTPASNQPSSFDSIEGVAALQADYAGLAKRASDDHEVAAGWAATGAQWACEWHQMLGQNAAIFNRISVGLQDVVTAASLARASRDMLAVAAILAGDRVQICNWLSAP